jgi:hypothetical protein
MKAIDLRWRPVLIGAFFCVIAAVFPFAAMPEVSRPIQHPGVFSPSEIEAARTTILLIELLSALAFLAAFVWMQRNALRLRVDATRTSASAERGFPIAWSRQKLPMEDVVLVVDARVHKNGGDVWFVCVALPDVRYDLQWFLSEQHAVNAAKEMGASTGITVV